MGAPAPQLPDKLYFKIGEAASIVGVKPHVLRYWESEFSIVRPNKSRSKHRLYRRKDVETLLQIKQLLHDQRFTIEGARKRLREGSRTGAARREPPGDAESCEVRLRHALQSVRRELQALVKLLR
ncbi:MerR family transcriptional regulator [Candidatus Binatia bacterium]|nr:MerR family transcriptional regulator [Candidatus Binatia bacterium]